MVSDQKESDTWRMLFLRVRLPFAAACVIVIGALLVASSVRLLLVLVIASWWAGPIVIYLVAIRTRILSWVIGAGFLALTASLLAAEVQPLRYWDEFVRPTIGFFQFPGGVVIKPLAEYFLVLAILLLEVAALAVRRRRLQM